MKAMVCNRYGPPDVLEYRDIATPINRDNEVLVRIYATSLNSADLEIMRGDFVNRITGPFKPMNKILGTDVAGMIVRTGKNIRDFKVGDEIWGDLSFPYRNGAFAEYVCIPEQGLRLKPESMSFEEAAAIPTAGVVALQDLFAERPLRSGQKVLINGGGGSVGTFAVQIAKHFGAEVTAVDSAAKLDMLTGLGADNVIDYTEEDFTKNGKQYDLILDVRVNRKISAYKRALTRNGVCIMVGGTISRAFINLFLGKLSRGEQKFSLGQWKPNRKEDLDTLQELFEAGKVRPVIDRRYSLKELPEAFRYFASGQAKGKLVVTVE